MPGTAERFWSLFEGAAKSHGTHGVPTGDGVKREIRGTALTIDGPVTEDLWRLHLAGTRPLGVVPIMEDDCCRWGAVDIDDYSIDAAELAKQLHAMRIPALVCKTKSGGAHVYLFFSEPVPGERVRARLGDLAALLGQARAEVFPKQSAFPKGEDAHGSWLNMPYLGGDGTNRFCVRADGRGMTVEAFLDAAENARIDAQALENLPLYRPAGDDVFESGPPCLQHLVGVGFKEGSRNNGLFALGTFAKKAYPDHWVNQLREWNQKFFNPPLTSTEENEVVASLRKKEYRYRCTELPISEHCRRTECRVRLHGIGNNDQDIDMFVSMNILLTDPKRYSVVLQTGGTVDVSMEEIFNMTTFRLAVYGQLDEVLPEYTKASWNKTLARLTREATRTETTGDSGINGRFQEILDRYVTGRYVAQTRDDILDGKPYRDEEGGQVYFTLVGLEQELSNAKFSSGEKEANIRSWITQRLRALGGKSKQTKIKGVNKNVWNLPADIFSWEMAPRDLPSSPDESPL